MQEIKTTDTRSIAKHWNYVRKCY